MSDPHVPGPVPGVPLAALPPIASDISPRRILTTLVGLLLAMTLAFVAATWLMNLYAHVNPFVTMPPNELTVQVDPVADPQKRTDWQTSERTELTSYGWVNRDKGIVRIPIRQAMELIAQRGLPVRPENQRPKEAEGGIDITAGARSGRGLEESRTILENK